MSIRPPAHRSDLPGIARVQTGFDTLEAELLAEQAAALGRAGKAVEKAMAALNAHEAGTVEAAQDEVRDALVKSAARAVHHYFIQRELCGYRRHDDAIGRYAIPREVLVRLGAS